MRDTSPAYRLYQGGQIVAATYGLGAEAEIIHYAAQYCQDGPVEIVQRRPNGRWAKR